MTEIATKRYEGIAGGINQNAGFPQSQKYGNGIRAVLGGAAVERAFAEGFTVDQILEWSNEVNADIGPKAKVLLSL